MASVQSLRDPIQRTTGGAARGTTTRRPATAGQVTVDMDALFGESPPPAATPSPRRADRAAAAPPVRAPARSRSHIAIAGLLIGMAALIALYVQLYSLNTERESAPTRQALTSPSPQAILPAAAPTRAEPLPSSSEPISAPTDNPVLRSLLAADRPAPPRTPRPVAEATVAATPAPLPPAQEPAVRQAAVPPEPVAPPPAATAPPPATAAAPETASASASTLLAAPAPPAPIALADPTPPTVRPITLVPVSRPQPAFPQQALRDRVSGRVVARVTVGTDGAVTAVQIESSTPPRVFDRAAVTALRQWRYAPIDRPQETTIELDFKLE